MFKKRIGNAFVNCFFSSSLNRQIFYWFRIKVKKKKWFLKFFIKLLVSLFIRTQNTSYCVYLSTICLAIIVIFCLVWYHYTAKQIKAKSVEKIKNKKFVVNINAGSVKCLGKWLEIFGKHWMSINMSNKMFCLFREKKTAVDRALLLIFET